MHRKLKSKGMLIPDADLLQASIAIANNLMLVTKNIRHFKNARRIWT